MSDLPKITARRELTSKDTLGMRWTVTEFDGGDRYMLTCYAAGTNHATHFTAQEWFDFQELIANP